MKTPGKIITGIFDGIAKVLAFFLITLGLWLPTLYSVVFFVACGLSNTPLSDAIMAAYWVGFGFTAVLGLALSMWVRKRRKNKEKAKNTTPIGMVSPAAQPEPKRKKKKKGGEEPVAGNPYYDPMAQVRQTQPVYPPQGYSQPVYPQGYTQPGMPYPPYPPYGTVPPVPPQSSYASAQPSVRQDTGDLDRKYFPDSAYAGGSSTDTPTPREYGRTASFDTAPDTERKREDTLSERTLGADELWRRLSGGDVPDEQPLVFRTRKDPNVYVYEYSDRYQYWRRTATGMVFEQTEFKKAEHRK